LSTIVHRASWIVQFCLASLPIVVGWASKAEPTATGRALLLKAQRQTVSDVVEALARDSVRPQRSGTFDPQYSLERVLE
jgi:hypothetical protein